MPPTERLHALQQAFLETGGAQCGICTPGMLMAGQAFLASGADPTDENIREAIAGNLCRCTGYTKIIDAIALAAERSSPGMTQQPESIPEALDEYDVTLALTPGQVILVAVGFYLLIRLIRGLRG